MYKLRTKGKYSHFSLIYLKVQVFLPFSYIWMIKYTPVLFKRKLSIFIFQNFCEYFWLYLLWFRYYMNKVEQECMSYIKCFTLRIPRLLWISFIFWNGFRGIVTCDYLSRMRFKFWNYLVIIITKCEMKFWDSNSGDMVLIHEYHVVILKRG